MKGEAARVCICPSIRPSHGHTSSLTVAVVLGRRTVRPGTCKTPPCSPRRLYRLCGPSSLQHNVYRGLLTSVIKRPGRQADISLPPSVYMKNVWSYISTSTYTFKAWSLTRQVINFTLTHHKLAVVPT